MDWRRTRTRDGSVRMRDGLPEWDRSPEYHFLARLKGWVFFLSFFRCESDERRQVGTSLIGGGHGLDRQWTRAWSAVDTCLTLGSSLPSSFGLVWVCEVSGNYLKVKSMCKTISGSKGLIYGQLKYIFSLNIFSCAPKHS